MFCFISLFKRKSVLNEKKKVLLKNDLEKKGCKKNFPGGQYLNYCLKFTLQ